MNCDQVFDILTRGPFPTGTACDMPVEAHLSTCPECHRLAEALRPAVELFQEAVDPEESRGLPGYWCAASSASDGDELDLLDHDNPLKRQRPARTLSYAQPIESRASAQHAAHAASPHLPALAMWRMAAMLAVGVTVGTLLAARGLDGISWPPRGVGAALAPAPESQSGAAWGELDLMELAALPGACYRHQPDPAPRYRLRDDQLLASARLENLSCCSGCHNAGSDQVPSTATLTVARSCQHCHAESSARLISAR